MGVQVIQMFAPTNLSSTPVTLYTFTAGASGAVLQRGRIRFVNNGTTSTTVSANAIQTGTTASAANTFLPSTSIAQNATLDVDVPVMTLNGTLTATCAGGTIVAAQAMDGIIFSP
jgi:hypothetical protein